VRVDEPRHERGTRKIDDLRAGRRDAGGAPGPLDRVSADQHGPARVHVLAIEHPCGFQEVGRRRLCVARATVESGNEPGHEHDQRGARRGSSHRCVSRGGSVHVPMELSVPIG
jgi:hypothetical protein